MGTKPNIKVALTSAVVISGEIYKKDQEVLVEHALAQDLLRRGRCTLADVIVDDESTAESDDEIDLTTLTKPQLLEQAAAYQVKVSEDMSESEIIDAIVTVANAE